MSQDPPPANRLERPLVLVLDDESCVRSTIEIMLRRSGYDTLGAGSGHEALSLMAAAAAAGRRIDLAVLDLTLPGGESGESVLGRLAAANPSLRAIATSGDVEHPAMIAPEATGFAACLAKPFRLADLASTLETVRAKSPLR